MRRRKFTRWNKERVSIYASAGLVVCVCVVSGIYAGSQSPSNKQMIEIGVTDEQVTEGATITDGQSASVDEPEVVATATEDESLGISAQMESAETTQESDNVEDLTVAGEADLADLTGDAELASNSEVIIDEKVTETVNVQSLHFDESKGMSWPVTGDIIMSYSMDERIYFATLNEYCYYPAVAISAEVGQTVVAAAKGKVTKVGINEEIGQYVTMDLGDGFVATYGQLSDIQTKQGKTVSTGQVIGYVSAPTKYYSIEGANMYFKLEKDGESINPLLYFQ